MGCDCWAGWVPRKNPRTGEPMKKKVRCPDMVVVEINDVYPCENCVPRVYEQWVAR